MKTENKVNFLYGSADQVELAFYEAFGNGDYELMESLYADQGVSCTHPGSSTIVGRDQVIDYWKFVLEGIPKAIINREVLSVSKFDNIEVHQVLESFEIDKFTKECSEVYTTNIFILQKNGWRLQMQHASVPEMKRPEPKLSLTNLLKINIQDFNENRVLN